MNNDLAVTKRRTVHGLSYALRESGPCDGRPVWLLHGLLDTGSSFAGLVAALTEHHAVRARFIAVDWRGHGESDAAAGEYWFPHYVSDLDALIAQDADPRPAVLIGHSMGGQVASLYAGTRQARVARLVTLDSLNVPDADPAHAPTRYRQWLDARDAPPRRRTFTDSAALARRIARRYPELAHADRARLARQWSRAVGETGRELVFDPWHRVAFPYGFRLAEALAIWREVTAPVLCLDGGASPARPLVSETEMAARHACFARLERIVLDDAGHMLHVQRTAEVAAAIARFLEAPADET